ncbi:MAG: hypothetical protein ACAI44_36230, partial [Candidatus Sericytochromatia bacterium]
MANSQWPMADGRNKRDFLLSPAIGHEPSAISPPGGPLMENVYVCPVCEREVDDAIIPFHK